ncbi:hypothetical protein HOC01_05040 [archaeon]|mgnify:CR=1|jgi:uncharacterized membrane protein|nr:hypothetical protein [archaeon]MBT6698333.1 hypothetical protein [archaeon]
MTNAKVIAVVSYITLVGWIIALILNLQKKQALASFHIRQSLMLILASVVAGILGTVLFFIPFIAPILYIVVFVLWVIGLINAIKGEQKQIPLVGSFAQKWFKSL